jgi:fructoselysine-6-P-deglycase FrlB-like protein
MSMCDKGSVIVALVTPERAGRELAVLRDVAPLSGRTVRLGSGLDLDVPSDLPAWARPVLYLLPLQVLALERALVRGLDPDCPRYLTAAIHLDSADPA